MTTKKNRKNRSTKKKNINHEDDILTDLKRFIMSRKLKKAKAKAKTLSNNRLNMSGGVDITTIQNAKQAVLYKETMAADAKKQATALRNKARTARALVTDNLTPDKRAILDLQAKTAESEAEQKDKIANMKEEEALVARLELNALELDQEASTEKLKLMNVNRETVVTTDDQNDRATRASELTTTWNNAKTKADEARRQADVAATKLIETKAKANNEETTITRAVPNISEISKITIDQAKTALAYAETQKKRAVDNVAKMESIAETERSSLKTGQAFQGNKPELITRLQKKLSQAEENLKQAKEKEQLANENFSSATATYIAKDKMEKDNEAKRIARLEANAIREAKITRGEDKEKRGTIETRDIIMARYKERKKAEQAAAEKVAAEAAQQAAEQAAAEKVAAEAKIQAAQQTAQQAAEQAVEEAEKALKLADERLSIAKKAESESYTKLGVAEKREKGGLSHIADVPEAKAFLEANIEKVRAIMDTRAAAMAILNAAKATARAINDDMKKKAAELTVTANEQMTIAQTREKQAVMMEKKAEGVRPALLEKEKEKASKAASIKAYKLGAQTASKADQMDGIIQNKDRVDGANSEARNIEINNTTAAEAAAAEAAAEEAAAAEAAAAEAAAAEAAAAEAAAAEAPAEAAEEAVRDKTIQNDPTREDELTDEEFAAIEADIKSAKKQAQIDDEKISDNDKNLIENEFKNIYESINAALFNHIIDESRKDPKINHIELQDGRHINLLEKLKLSINTYDREEQYKELIDRFYFSHKNKRNFINKYKKLVAKYKKKLCDYKMYEKNDLTEYLLNNQDNSSTDKYKEVIMYRKFDIYCDTSPAEAATAKAPEAAAAEAAKEKVDNIVSQPSATRKELQAVYEKADESLNAYFSTKDMKKIESHSVEIDQSINSQSLGFSVNSNGIIISFQPDQNGNTQSQVKAAGLTKGDLILTYVINDDTLPKKVYIFIDQTDMKKKTNGKNITINYVRGIKTNDAKENSVLNELIKARRSAWIPLDKLTELESNYASAEGKLDDYIRNKSLKKKSADTEKGDYGLSTQDSGDSTIVSLGPTGSIYEAGLRVGDIILTYEVSNETYIYVGLTDFSDRTKEASSIGITYIKNSELGNDGTVKDHLIKLIKARIQAKIALDAYLKELKKTPGATGTSAPGTSVPGQPISNDQKIKNTIGAIILALALTISESMPKTKIGNSSGKKYNPEEIEKMQAEYDELTKKIENTITTKRTSYEARFNEIKTKSGNKKSKKMELIAVLNNLLTNKRTIEEFEKPDLEKPDEKNMAGGGGCSIYDTDPECTLGSNFYNAKTKEIEKHRRTINEIMSYLLEEKINMKYEWVAIKGIGGKDKDLYKGKVGIISKLNNNNTEDVDIKGKWAFEVWIPDKGGLTTLVHPDDNGYKKKLQVKNSKQEIIDKFLTKNISIYEVQFLDKQYDHTNDINFQPVIDGENLEPISSLKKHFLAKNYNTITNAINPTDFAKGTYTTAEGLTTKLTTRGLREDLKELIKNVIETKFTEQKDVALLTTKINFYNKKKSIKDILISKISYIFASGETRLNLFNRSNVKKNFKEDEEAQNDGEEAQEGGEEAQEGGEEAQEGGEEAQNDGEEGDYIKEGGGGYGTRNFDKDDAKNFIKFILESLTALHYENIPKTTKNLLFSNYLKALLKITPSELNKLLLDIDNISELSNNVIEHYINRLTNNQKSVSDQATTPAAKISKLNFALKSNVQAFTKSIVYITLHSEQMVGSEEKVEEYLDNEYNKAMKLPTGEDQGRISNFELKSALNSILGAGTNTIKGYKEKIQKIDSHIDSINAKNITTKLKDFHTVFSLGKLENGTIIYNLPAKISGNLKAQETKETKEATLEASSKEKLNQAVALLKEMLASSKDTDSMQKKKLEQFLTSLNPKDEE